MQMLGTLEIKFSVLNSQLFHASLQVDSKATKNTQLKHAACFNQPFRGTSLLQYYLQLQAGLWHGSAVTAHQLLPLDQAAQHAAGCMGVHPPWPTARIRMARVPLALRLSAGHTASSADSGLLFQDIGVDVLAEAACSEEREQPQVQMQLGQAAMQPCYNRSPHIARCTAQLQAAPRHPQCKYSDLPARNAWQPTSDRLAAVAQVAQLGIGALRAGVCEQEGYVWWLLAPAAVRRAALARNPTNRAQPAYAQWWGACMAGRTAHPG